MGLSAQPGLPAYRKLRMPRKRPQVLEVGLNPPESSSPAATVCPALERDRVLLERAADPLHTPRKASTDSFLNHRALELGEHPHHLKHRGPTLTRGGLGGGGVPGARYTSPFAWPWGTNLAATPCAQAQLAPGSTTVAWSHPA
jgi:hypothetical protein